MRSIALLLLVSAAAFGQRATGNSPYARSTTFGSSITSSVVHAGHGATLNTYPGGARFHNRNGAGAVIYVPYAVGGYYGGYYYGDQGMQPPPGGYPQQQYMGPQVVINQNFAPDVARPIEYVPDANGGIRVYGPQSQVSAPETTVAEESPTFLIAFKDHTIYAAIAYWVEGDTLHYVTNQSTHNQVSLDLVDRELSDRLNRERQVDFRLPARK
jgi:hypothetical protein